MSRPHGSTLAPSRHGSLGLEAGGSLLDLPAGLVTALLLVLCWSVGLRMGSEGGGTHWFYVPILYASLTLGSRGSAAAVAAAAFLAGPLMPADPQIPVAQEPVAWLVRTAVFLAVGQAAAALSHRRRALDRRLQPYVKVVRERDQEAAEIRAIIEEDRLSMHFQPIVELATGRVTGMKSLARFPLEEEQAPERWFSRAWAAGVGPDLEIAALEKAVDLGESLPRSVYQSVNLSPEILTSERFQQLLHELPWNRLVVEITEHLKIEDYQSLAGPIAAIRARGGRLAIDDVGAGFASLRHVLSLAPEIIKLDTSLSHGLDHSLPRASLARGLVACAEELGATVVAEGIETPQDARSLQRVGAHCVQGFLFGRPAPLARLAIHLPEASSEREPVRALRSA